MRVSACGRYGLWSGASSWRRAEFCQRGWQQASYEQIAGKQWRGRASKRRGEVKKKRAGSEAIHEDPAGGPCLCRSGMPHLPPPGWLLLLPHSYLYPLGLCGPLLSLQRNPISLSLSQPPPSKPDSPLSGQRLLPLKNRATRRPATRKDVRACFPQAFLNCELVGHVRENDGPAS
jgi:hypothetical protein